MKPAARTWPRRRAVGAAVDAAPVAPRAAGPLLCALVLFAAPAPGRSVTVEDIFREPRIEGIRPQIEALSPDAKWVAYGWNAEGYVRPLDLYIVSTSGGHSRALTHFPRDTRADSIARAAGMALADSAVRKLPVYFDDTTQDHRITALAWSPDSRRIAFATRGELYVTELEAGSLRRLTYTRGGESDPVWSPDGRSIAFLRDGALWLLQPEVALEVQLTEAGGDSAAPSNLRWSPDSRRIAYTVRDDRGLADLVVPDYLGERVKNATVKEGFPEMGVRIVELGALAARPDPAKILRDEKFRRVAVRLPGKKHPLVSAVAWSPDATRLAVSEILTDMRTRHVHVAGVDSGSVHTVFTERDSAWLEEFEWGIVDRPVLAWSPDNAWILTATERTGYNHLVRVPAGGGHAEQLTDGAWEAAWAEWLPDGRRILLLGNRTDPSERHIELLDVATRKLTQLGTATGMNTHPQIGLRGDRIVYRHSRFSKPADLWSLETRPGSRPVRLTNTVPRSFTAVDWNVPEIVHFPARDGTPLHGLLYRPQPFAPGQRYPVVVFVHGAGSFQNVVDGWTIYSPNYKFHTVLAQKGYVVFEVDYRGSLGYGRDFRTGIYDFIGGKDLEDELAGVDYLRRLDFVDASRIGIYGGSYGGFMALMALFKSPQEFACGAALRFVSDWVNYYRGNPWYCVQRLRTPEENPVGYYRSSPIHFAGGLEDPLLLLHGVRDDNVHFQDAAQLTERLIRLGKDFELMMYPRESHGFTAPASWIDEYRRIEEFFDRYLEPGGAHGPPTSVGGSGGR